MTYEDYINEHGNDVPETSSDVCSCPVCGEPVYHTFGNFTNESDFVHAGCLEDYIKERFTLKEVAKALDISEY